MPKVLEFAYAQIYLGPEIDKVKAIITKADKMSAEGWDYKGFYDNVTEITLFFQREKEATPATSHPDPAPPSIPTPPLN